MQRISWEHIFPGRREHPVRLAIYICSEADPWHDDGFLDVRLPAYRDDGPTMDRPLDEEIRWMAVDNVQESIQEPLKYCSFDRSRALHYVASFHKIFQALHAWKPAG